MSFVTCLLLYNSSSFFPSIFLRFIFYVCYVSVGLYTRVRCSRRSEATGPRELKLQADGMRPGTESRTGKVSVMLLKSLKGIGPAESAKTAKQHPLGSVQYRTELPERCLWMSVCLNSFEEEGFCDCCQEASAEFHVHLHSAQHQGFAQEDHPYTEVDQIITQLSHDFTDTASGAKLPTLGSGLCSYQRAQVPSGATSDPSMTNSNHGS
eukprot:XP_017453213.1 PREDICTED: protein DBF4 homolog B [Rattus norvegicus]